MNDHQQITPRPNPILGPAKLAFITAATIVIFWYVLNSRIADPTDLDLQLQEMFPTGCIYGLLATGCWLSTAIRHRYARLLCRIVFVIAATLLHSDLRESRSWIQTAADFTGMAIAQSAIFFWFQVPAWRTSWSTNEFERAAKGHRFAVADIAVTTLVVAILLAFAIRYSPSSQPSKYWMVLTTAWIGGAIVTSCIASGMTTRSTRQAIGWILFAELLAVLGTYAIAIADSMVDEGKVRNESVAVFVSYYGRVVAGYVTTFLIFSSFARFPSPATQERFGESRKHRQPPDS